MYDESHPRPNASGMSNDFSEALFLTRHERKFSSTAGQNYLNSGLLREWKIFRIFLHSYGVKSHPLLNDCKKKVNDPLGLLAVSP